MADPVISGVIRALCVLPNTNGLPADRYITTWAFGKSGAAVSADASFITSMIQGFWSNTSGGAALHTFIGPQVSRATNACKVICYDLAESPPRTPYTNFFTMGPLTESSGAGMPLPAEVALCLSLKTALNGPSGRGRVYVGPFSVAALTLGAFGDAKPSAGLLNTLSGTASALAGASHVAPAHPWKVVSHKLAQANDVTVGYIDNAFDTQRSRGILSSGRTPFAF